MAWEVKIDPNIVFVRHVGNRSFCRMSNHRCKKNV